MFLSLAAANSLITSMSQLTELVSPADPYPSPPWSVAASLSLPLSLIFLQFSKFLRTNMNKRAISWTVLVTWKSGSGPAFPLTRIIYKSVLKFLDIWLIWGVFWFGYHFFFWFLFLILLHGGEWRWFAYYLGGRRVLQFPLQLRQFLWMYILCFECSSIFIFFAF